MFGRVEWNYRAKDRRPVIAKVGMYCTATKRGMRRRKGGVLGGSGKNLLRAATDTICNHRRQAKAFHVVRTLGEKCVVGFRLEVYTLCS